jgi:hypothetical protein
MRRHDLLTGVLALIAALAVATAACTGSASPDTAATPPSPSVTSATATSVANSPTKGVVTTPTPTGRDVAQESDVTPTLAAPDLELSAEADRVVQLAKEDLAQRLGIARESIQLVSMEAEEWPDASLGCPQPGETYAQVITPGLRVRLVAQEQVYEYHTDAGQFAVLCQEEPMPNEQISPANIEPGLEVLVDRAMQDLAGRLSIPVEQIELLEAKSVVWPDASLGCPQPGMGYAQVLLEGALIQLRVGPFRYDYHSGGSQSPFLCEQFPPGTKSTEPPGYEPLPLTPPSD